MQRPSLLCGRLAACALMLGGFVLAAVMGACGNGDDESQNRRPSVRLTGGPVDQGGAPIDSINYATEFVWVGMDEDGIIDHYQYAIDIPEHYSLEDINNPADVGIAWRDTTVSRARFLFSATEQDTILNTDGTITETDRFVGEHTFHIRAVDDQGAISDAAWAAFTAWTILPQTTFTSPLPALSGLPLSVGPGFAVSWTGLDPDSPHPGQQPAYYEWKLFEVPFVAAINDVNYNIKDPNGEGYNVPWNRVEAVSAPRLPMIFNPPADYIFAIRAVDEAGGVENRFFTGRNALLLSATDFAAVPNLTVSEKSAGSFEFPFSGPVWEFEAAANQCMTFHFVGDAEHYGGVMQGYNYGLNVDDVDDETQFQGWSLIPYTEPICIATPGFHTLTVKARDTAGGVAVGQILMHIIAMPLDRELLYVDDHRLNIGAQGVTDANMDAKVIDMLAAVGFSSAEGTLFIYEPWGSGDLMATPTPITLSQLSRYKQVMWSVLGTGYNGNPALILANGCPTGRVLQAYLLAGGSLWVYGQTVFGAFKKFPGGECKADVTYSESTGLFFESGEFIADFLHISGGDIRSVKTNPQTHGLVRATPTPRAAVDLFPALEIDSTLFTSTTLGGIPSYDAMFEPKFTAGLDTVYVAGATARTNSSFRNRPIAFRYADQDPVPSQGPVAVFGFPLHFFKPGSVSGSLEAGTIQGSGVKGMAAAMFRWLRQHGAVAQAALASG